MYLYKAACPDIPNPKQKVSRAPGGLQVQVPGPVPGRPTGRASAETAGRSRDPVMLWTSSKSSSAAQLKQLEEFLNVHSLSLLDSVRSRTGMIYR